MLNFLKRNETLRNVLINTTGTYLNIFFIAVFAIVTVRILTPSQYGVLSVLLGITYVLANILDLGVSATLYANIPVIYENKEKLRKFIKASFLYQSSIAILIISLLIISFPKLDEIFFKTGASSWELNLTAFSILFFVWQNFLVNSLLAAKRVIESNLYLNISNVVKTIVLFLLIISKKISIASLIFTFGILGPAAFFLMVVINKKDAFYYTVKAPFEKEQLDFSYIFAFFLASQFFNLATKIDLFLLSYYLSKDIVGYYGLAQKIVLTVAMSISSITQILSPKFAKAKTKQEIKKVSKEALRFLLFPTLGYIGIIILPTQIYEIVFTSKFLPAFPIVRSLSLSFLFYPLANIPYLLLLYTFKKPKYNLIANMILFLTIATGCYFGIPKHGVYAPIIIIFLAILITTGFSIAMVLKLIKIKQ